MDLIRYLDRESFHPIVVSLYMENADNTMLPQYRDAGIDCICLKLGRVKSILQGGKRVKAIMTQIKPDLIHSVGMPLYRMAIKYSGCPNFTTIHNYVYEDYPVKYGKILGNIMAKHDLHIIWNNAKYMVTCSRSLAEIYMNRHNINVDFIRNGVDVSRFYSTTPEEKIDLRETLNLPKNKMIAVFTGQICERKNQIFAIEGLLKYNRDNVCLLLLGGGADFVTLRNRYSKSCNIIFTGEVSNVSDYLMASDFYISSSTSEGLPISVLEAMASGLPIMLSDIIQHKEIIESCSDLGMLFHNNNIESFLTTLDAMLKSDLPEMGRNCKHVSNTIFSAEIMTRLYENKYLSFINDINKL